LSITVILIEHRLDRVLAYADRIIILDQGKVAVDCNIREILDHNFQKIAEIGIGIPPIIRLTHELRNRGLDIDGNTPLTVKEARTIIHDELSKMHYPLPHSEIKYQGRPLIEMEKLWFAYPEGATALRKVSLKIHRGEFVAVMGRNASGKTTLIKHFNGLLKPVKGRVVVDGIDTRKATTAELSRKVGFVSQNPNEHLFADTVEEEVRFALKNLGFSHDKIMARTDQAIALFRLSEHRQRYPRSLSGGEKQRVALASVVAVQPQILILDEPTRGMEYRLKAELMTFLQDYVRKDNTVILVTHDVEIAAEYADRVILLSEGEIVTDGATHEVLSQALLFSPQINRLVQPYTKLGIPSDILTVEELLQVLK
jgi:energy-coupling factor transport system ATP-binding protein